MIKTAIVILNWNGESYLKKFLPGVLKNSLDSDVKIYVADNGSTDQSLNILRSDFPEVELIIFEKNYGFTEGYNKALIEIDAQYYLLLNSDIEVTAGWVTPLTDILERDENTAVVMPKIKAYHKPNHFEYAGAAGGFIDKFGYPFCRGRILNVIEEDDGQYDQEIEIFWATGACMCIKADVFHKSGGFDSFMFAHMEEIDLSWRLKNMGYKIMFTPKSTVYHVGGGTLPNEHPQKLYYNFRNNLILLYKNLPKNKLIPTLFSRLILDGVAAIKYFITLKFSFVWAVLRAHYRFYSVVGKYRKVRRQHADLIVEYPDNILKKSILTQFYLKRIHKFSDLKFDK